MNIFLNRTGAGLPNDLFYFLVQVAAPDTEYFCGPGDIVFIFFELLLDIFSFKNLLGFLQIIDGQ